MAEWKPGWEGLHKEKLKRQKLYHQSLINTFRIWDMIVRDNRIPLKDFKYENNEVILIFIVFLWAFKNVFILR